MREIGFSTGAIALDDFNQALGYLSAVSTHAIELSALRFKELRPLVSALPDLNLTKYTYISMHVPSSYSAEEEVELVSLLCDVPPSWALIVHPDAIHNYELWRSLSSRVAIENMDRRKSSGRTAKELAKWFDLLPDTKFLF